MPTICEFYGIKIAMYFSDHEPSHIHVFHGGTAAVMDIISGEILVGALRPRAKQMVSEWLELHREELEYAWKTQCIMKIDPLD